MFTATILAAVIGTTVMGLWANWPVAMAPGMGLNAFFTYGVVLSMGHSWQVALGAVFCSGVLFLILSATKVRQWIIEAMPKSLRLGVGAGIGFFLAIIGLRNAGIVVDSPATLVTIGDLTSSTAALAILGFIAMMVLDARKVPGAIVIGILVVTIIGLVTGDASWGGGAWLPPSLAPTFFVLDLSTIFEIGLIVVVLTFLFVDFFDTAGTLTSVANMAGKVDADGKVEGIGRAVISDGAAPTAGALLGTSSTTSYIESGAGIKEGGPHRPHRDHRGGAVPAVPVPGAHRQRDRHRLYRLCPRQGAHGSREGHPRGRVAAGDRQRALLRQGLLVRPPSASRRPASSGSTSAAIASSCSPRSW